MRQATSAGKDRIRLEAAKGTTARDVLNGLDVRVVVLVGGRDFGRCPLASHLPTALWPIADKPALVRLLDHLADAGIGRAVVCCAKDISAMIGAACQEARLEAKLVVEELTTGTAGCLRDAVASDPGDLIIVLSGSMMAPPPIARVVEAHQAGGAELTMTFSPSHSDATAAGRPAEIYLGQPQILRHVPRRGYSDIKEGLIPAILRARGTVHPVVLDRDVGNFHNRVGYLNSLEAFVQSSACDGRDTMLRRRPGEHLVLEGQGVSIHPTARICGPVVIADQARISEGAVVVGPAMIGKNAVLSENSLVVRSALWAGARVGGGCEIRESIVDCGVVVPRRKAIVGRTVSYNIWGGSLVGRWVGFVRQHARRIRERARPSFDLPTARLPVWAQCSPKHFAQAVGGMIVFVAFLWSYWPTVTDLMGVWQRSDEYSSGRLVPFLAAYIVWSRRQDIGSVTIRPALAWGIGVFLVAQALRYAGVTYFYSSAERLSLILSIGSLVLLVLGWKYLGRLATVLLFLCLMLPWPNRIQGAIARPLQEWSTTSAVFCLELVGCEVQRDGNVIGIGESSVAVAEACNGLRMITAFFVISGLVALLVKRAWWQKLILLLSSLPIAFLCNTLRLAMTAMFFTIVEGKQWEDWFHAWGGYAMMPLALALVVGELWVLARLTTPPTQAEPAIISRRRA